MTADRSVARDAEPAGLIAAIAARPSWLTVVGLPGVGKSYLVASVMGRDERTLWVSAERSTSEADLAERIAAACSVAPCDFSRALGRVVERGARTLVLDGADAIPASIAARIMAACKERGLTVLATARRPIGFGGEVLHPLLPLDRATGSRLFWRIAGESETTLSGMPAGAVEEIVARTDGLPAHLVLLANRLRTYGWDFVRERFLEAPGPRSESILAHTEEAFGASVALLGPGERRILGAFSVIADDVGLEAVERIVGPLWDDSGGASIADVLAGLVAAGLVRQSEAGGRVTFAGLELARRAAARELPDDVRVALVRAYASYLTASDRAAPGSTLRRLLALELATDSSAETLEPLIWALASSGFRGAAGHEDVALADRCLARLEPAAPHALADRLRLARALFLLTSGRLDEAGAVFAGFLDDAGGARDSLLDAHAHEGLARAAYLRLDNAAALTELGRARDLFLAAGRDADVARVLHHLAETLEALGKLDEARVVLVDLLSRSAVMRDPVLGARASASLGSIALECGDTAQALDRYADALVVFRAQRDLDRVMVVEGYRGIALLHDGALARARETLTRTVDAARGRGRRDVEGLFAASLAVAHAHLGHAVEAEALLHLATAASENRPMLAGVVEIQALHLPLARLLLEGDGDGEVERRGAGLRSAAELIERMRAPTSETALLLDVSDDARISLRFLRSKLAELDVTIAQRRVEVPVYILAEGRGFRARGVVVSLSGKPRLKRILHALATTPTNGRRSADELIAAGWPERRSTKALEKAARNRLHVAIAELRSLGLRDVLVRSDDGYHLENVRCAAEPPT